MVLDKGRQQLFVGPAIAPQGLSRYIQGTMQKNGRSIGKRMGKGYFRIDPGETVAMKCKGSEKR